MFLSHDITSYMSFGFSFSFVEIITLF